MKSKTTKGLEADKTQALQQQNTAWDKASQDGPEITQFRKEKGAFDSWLGGKDYSHGPEGSMLNFDLWSPSKVAQTTDRLANLQGVGAANMGGNDSIALQLSKQHGAAEAAQNAGQSYEQAVGNEQNYYRGAAPGYMAADNAKWGNLFGQTSQNYDDAWGRYAKYQKPSIWGQLIGAGLTAAGGYFGGPAGAKLGGSIGGAIGGR